MECVPKRPCHAPYCIAEIRAHIALPTSHSAAYSKPRVMQFSLRYDF
jgi:hypothetical protein